MRVWLSISFLPIAVKVKRQQVVYHPALAELGFPTVYGLVSLAEQVMRQRSRASRQKPVVNSSEPQA